MKQQLAQQQRPEPGEPEKSTKEETELAFAILDTDNGVTVERTATTFAAEVLEQDGERQITIDEDTDTTVFTIAQEYDVDLPNAWEEIDDLMPVITAEHTAEAAWDLLQLHFMTLPAPETVRTDAIRFAPEEPANTASTDADLDLDLEHTVATQQSGTSATPETAPYPSPKTAEQLYEYGDLIGDTFKDAIQLPLSDELYLDTAAVQDGSDLPDDLLTSNNADIVPDDMVQYDADAASYTQEDTEQVVTRRLFDPDTTATGAEQELTYTVSADTSANAAEAVEQLFAETDLSGSVEKMTYQDTEDGYRTKESYWVEIDGMDMARTEFFINGELAEESLDAYDLDPGDSITFVEADLFDSSDSNSGGACGGDLYLDDVIDSYANEEVTAVNAAYGPQDAPDEVDADPYTAPGVNRGTA